MKRLISILLIFMMMLTVPVVPVFAAGTIKLETNKTEYKYGEDIVVTAAGGTNKAWVGLYNKGEKPGSGDGMVASLYWYYSNEDWSLGKEIVLQNQTRGRGDTVLPAGEYELHLFKDGGYTKLKTVEITITSEPIIKDPVEGDIKGNLVSISYELDNETDGLANGTVTVVADDAAIAGADCIMYWADADGEPLKNYTPLAKFRLTGAETNHEMYDYTLIPEGAKKLIAYQSKSGSLIGDAVSVELPEGCNYKLKDDYNVEFQLISDIHINEGDHAYNKHFTQMLEDVKKYSPNSIGIFVNGDIADNGREKQYERLVELYTSAKSTGKLPNMHISIGNHDWSGGNPDGLFQKYAKALNTGLAKAPEKVYYDEEIAGYRFIFLGSEQSGGNATLSKEQLAWFDNRMAEITAENPEKPVFVLLHQPLYNTVAGSLPGQGWHGVNDEQKLKNVLKKYEQIIIAGGHSHWELDSVSNMYPGDDNMSVAVNTASVAYLWTSYNVAGGEHADGSHGYYVRVYDDKVVFLGRDIENSRFVSSGMFVVEKHPIVTSKEEYTLDLENNLADMKAYAVDGGKLEFASSDSEVVDVTADGILRAKKVGTATITISAEASDRYVKGSKRVVVNVVEPQEDESEVPSEPGHVHDWDTGKVVIKPTCTEKGAKTFVCKSDASHTKTEIIPVDEDNHNYKAEVTKATCQTKGYTTYTCECGDVYKDDETAIKPENHQWEVGKVVEATCTKDGYTLYECECGSTSRRNIVEATDHDWNDGKIVIKPTCMEKGTKEFECKNDSNHTKLESVPVDKNRHRYTYEVTKATCQTKGYTTYTCECGDVYKDDETPINPDNHKWGTGKVVNATCIEKGYTLYNCSCGAEAKLYKLINSEPTGHKYGEYEVEQAATFGKEGIKVAKCKNEGCADKLEAKIPAVKAPTLHDDAYVFDDENKTPIVLVADVDGNKIPASVTFEKSTRKAVGKYAVNVELLGEEHSGVTTACFVINPATRSLSKVSASKKAFKATWKKPSSTYRKQMTGYQLRYSTSSKMTSAKIVTVKGTTATSKTIKKLKSKKTYYVQLRTYKTVGSDKYYSDWSGTKKVKIK